MLLEVGQTYAGRYRIARKLGEGAMGSVYEAEHLLIHRRVALKLLHPHVLDRHGALHRFEREAQAAGRIGSPHIVEVLDMGEVAAADGSGAARFIVMELLEGETLQQRVRSRGRLAPEDAAALACQILAGLGAAHAADIVHRDLKPANVFLVRGRAGGDFVKLLDFGVSKFNAADDMAQTAPGAALGTPYYMSPEQAKGAPLVDARSDLYSVGVILYECVTGQVPFDAGTYNELIFRIVLESPPPLESFLPQADPRFVAIVQKAMAREPDERWRSAQEMHDALAQWLAEASGKPFAPGVVPWGEAEPFVPRGGAGVSSGASTTLFEQAPTLLREPPGPRRKRPLALGLGALALLGLGGGAFLALRAPGPREAASAAVSASLSATATAATAPASATASAGTATASATASPAPGPKPAAAAPASGRVPSTGAGPAKVAATAAPTGAPARPAPPPAGRASRTVTSDL